MAEASLSSLRSHRRAGGSAAGFVAILLLAFPLGAAERTAGTVSVETHEGDAPPDVLGEIAVRYLCGFDQRSESNHAPGTLKPSWFVAWARAYRTLWQRAPAEWDRDHPLAHLKPQLALETADGQWRVESVPWRTLACASKMPPLVRLDDLGHDRDGTVLLGIEARCALGATAGKGAAQVRVVRLVARVSALGQPQSLSGVSLVSAFGRSNAVWPVRPAVLKAPAQPLQRIGQRWLALVARQPGVEQEHDHAGLDAPVMAELSELPGPQSVDDGSLRTGGDNDENKGAGLWLFHDNGTLGTVLFEGVVAPTPAEQKAAVARRPGEGRLPAATSLAVLPLANVGPEITIIGNGREALVLMTLLIGEASVDGAIINAGVAAWRWLGDAPPQRVDIRLPRTAAEGIWRCEADDAGAALRCAVAGPVVPDGVLFESRTLRWSNNAYEAAK